MSTVIFNANPLLRYDGYYILADLMEIPNLRQKATTILSRKLGEWFLGLEPPDDPFLPQRNQIFFALYSVAAAVYRWVVVLLDPLVPVQALQALPAEDHRPGDRGWCRCTGCSSCRCTSWASSSTCPGGSTK